MNQFNFSRVSPVIRRVMKSRKMTYEDMAKRLSMSGSGVKKLLAAEDCSLNKLQKICAILGIEVSELLRSSKEAKSTEIRFTDEQEKFLLRNPNTFFFFWELIEDGMTLEKLREKYDLDERSVRKYAAALDKIGLIELHPGDKVKHRFHGRTHWNMVNSSLGQFALSEFEDGFLKRLRTPQEGTKSPFDRVLKWTNFKLRRNTYNEFVAATRNLLKEFRNRSHRENSLSSPEELVPVGALFGVMEFRFSDIIQIPRI